MILVVTYDLKEPAVSYPALFEVLKGEDSWAHYLDSMWLIATDDTPREFLKKLLPHLLKGDRIFISELVPGYAGWLPQKAWSWIRRHRDDDDDNED